MIVAATGHRPDKLGGYSADVKDKLFRGACRYIDLMDAKGLLILKAISGMALGWDQAFALAALESGIPLIAAIPFAGQDTKWHPLDRDAYDRMLARSERVHVVCNGGYANWKFQRRNEWMVDEADRLVALWDGSAGGTANCLKYAAQKKKPVDNLWRSYSKNAGLA